MLSFARVTTHQAIFADTQQLSSLWVAYPLKQLLPDLLDVLCLLLSPSLNRMWRQGVGRTNRIGILLVTLNIRIQDINGGRLATLPICGFINSKQEHVLPIELILVRQSVLYSEQFKNSGHGSLAEDDLFVKLIQLEQHTLHLSRLLLYIFCHCEVLPLKSFELVFLLQL